MPKDFTELANNSSQKVIDQAILDLTPLMSKRLARLLDVKEKKRAERNENLIAVSKTNKEGFVLSYNLVVEMREERVEKMIKIFRNLLEWAKKLKDVRSIDDVMGVIEDAVRE